MAWQVINLSLHLSSSEERKIQRGKKEEEEGEEEESERGRKGGRGLGLNRTTGPWSPSWSFKWSKAKRSKCWRYKRSLIQQL